LPSRIKAPSRFLVFVLGLNLLLLCGSMLLGRDWSEWHMLLLQAFGPLRQRCGKDFQRPRRMFVEDAVSQPKRSLSLPA
jgi:hypothetical protein